jgi:integrase
VANDEDLDALRAWLDAQQYSPRTVGTYYHHAKRAARWLNVPLRDAQLDDLRKWWSTLTPTNRMQCRKALVAFYRALDRPDVDNPACSLPKLPPPDRLPRPLSADQLATFIAAARRLGGVHEVIALFFATTGCRFEELRCARWADIDLGTDASWRICGKGSARRGPKWRRVPLHPALVSVLTTQRPDPASGYVLPSEYPPEPIRIRRLRDLFAEVCADAGLEGVTPHRLRHTVATMALERTKDLRAVQELLGHASVATTQSYTLVSSDRVSAAVETLPVSAPTVPTPAPRRLELVTDGEVPRGRGGRSSVGDLEPDDDGPWPYPSLVDTLVARAGDLFAAVGAYRHRGELDTSPRERECLLAGYVLVERALDAVEGGFFT